MSGFVNWGEGKSVCVCECGERRGGGNQMSASSHFVYLIKYVFNTFTIDTTFYYFSTSIYYTGN